MRLSEVFCFVCVYIFLSTAEFPSLPVIKGQGWLETVAMRRCLLMVERAHKRCSPKPLIGAAAGTQGGERSGIQMVYGRRLPTVL